MLKKELADRLQKMFPEYLKEDMRDVVDIVFEQMAEALEKDRRIEIRGFGSFALHDQKEKVFTNPKTGRTITCPANKRIVFKAGKDIRKLPIEEEQTRQWVSEDKGSLNGNYGNAALPEPTDKKTDKEKVTVRQLDLF